MDVHASAIGAGAMATSSTSLDISSIRLDFGRKRRQLREISIDTYAGSDSLRFDDLHSCKFDFYYHSFTHYHIFQYFIVLFCSAVTLYGRQAVQCPQINYL